MPRYTQTDRERDADEVSRALAGLSSGISNRELRDRVLDMLPAFEAFRRICAGLVQPEIDDEAAKGRLLAYLQIHPRLLIDGRELALVSGISEWARRIRELRVEEGWRIYSGMTFSDMAADPEEDLAALSAELGFDPRLCRPSEYVLMSEDPDHDAKDRWVLANGLRKRVKKGLAVRKAIQLYLEANIGKPIPGEELRYLANDQKEWARRVRELRTQLGYPVLTKMQGRIDLPVGVYVLESSRKFEPHDRKISDATRVAVLERDSFACRICRWTRQQASPDDPRRNLELHHIEHHVAGGANTADNLITLCNVHHDDVHAGRITEQRLVDAREG